MSLAQAPFSRAVLSLENVDASYGEAIRVLHGITLQVAQGQVVALLGPNGAGKSTVLKSISNLLVAEGGRVTSGSVWFGEMRIDGLDPAVGASRGLAHVMEGRRLFPNLTVMENLRTGALGRASRGGVAADLDKVFQLFPRLSQRTSVNAGLLSGGEQQMVAIGRALMARPRLLLLDEPSMGLAPLVIAEIFAIVKTLRETEGLSILLAEQNVTAVLPLLDYAYVIESGSIAMQGTLEEIGGSEELANLYLGRRKAAPVTA